MTDTPPPQSAARAAVKIAISACCFGAIPVFVSLASGVGASLTTVLGYRYLIAAIVMGALVFGRSRPRVATRGSLWIVLIGGGGQTAVAFLGLSALKYIPVASATFLFYTYPAWVAVIAALRRTEPLTGVRLIALGLSLAGITVMIGGSTTVAANPAGVTLALGAALVYSIYIPTMERLQQGFTPLMTALLVCVGAMAAFMLLAAIDGSLTFSLHRTAWIVIVAMAMLSTVAAFQLFLGGLAVLGPVRTAIISTVEPFAASLLGASLLGQALTLPTLLGGAMIIGAVVLLQLKGRERVS